MGNIIKSYPDAENKNQSPRRPTANITADHARVINNNAPPNQSPIKIQREPTQGMATLTVHDGSRTIGGNKIHYEEKGRGVLLDFGMNFST